VSARVYGKTLAIVEPRFLIAFLVESEEHRHREKALRKIKIQPKKIFSMMR
jgi:hypothetical protein